MSSPTSINTPSEPESQELLMLDNNNNSSSPSPVKKRQKTSPFPSPCHPGGRESPFMFGCRKCGEANVQIDISNGNDEPTCTKCEESGGIFNHELNEQDEIKKKKKKKRTPLKQINARLCLPGQMMTKVKFLSSEYIPARHNQSQSSSSSKNTPYSNSTSTNSQVTSLSVTTSGTSSSFESTDSSDSFFPIPEPENVPTEHLADLKARFISEGRYGSNADADGPLKENEWVRFLMPSVSTPGKENAYTLRRTGKTDREGNGLIYICSCLPWFQSAKCCGRGFRGKMNKCYHTAMLRGQQNEDERCRVRPNSLVSYKNFSFALPCTLVKKDLESNVQGEEYESFICTEKFDGIRAFFDGDNFWSKSGMPIHPPDKFYRGLRRIDGQKIKLDGELWLRDGRGKFQELCHLALRSDMPSAWDNVVYMVFDMPEVLGGLESRLCEARSKVGGKICPQVEVVESTKLRSHQHLLEIFEGVLEIGGEGVVLSDPYARYTPGRFKEMLKLKKWQDDEALITGHKEGKGELVGYLGALECRGRNGVKFNLGLGFKMVERESAFVEEFLPIGNFVTYKFMELWFDHTKHVQLPRMPTFLRPASSRIFFPIQKELLMTVVVDEHLKSCGSSSQYI